MVQISLVVITLNEESNLPRCLESARGIVDEIVVVDSGSTDNTVAIAGSFGARVIVQPFLGHVGQKQFAIDQASNDYVLSLDADEALSPELKESILKVRHHWTHDCYTMNRRSNIGDQWIYHGAWYPDCKMRLSHRRKFTVIGINPHDKYVAAPGATTTHLKGDILHYTNSDIESRIKTVNNFSSIAAKAFQERGKKGSWFRLLAKPFFRFFGEYCFRLGFLDGFYGFVIAITSAQYVFLRESKLMERERGSRE